jgi:radical SAM superfamily enzyme
MLVLINSLNLYVVFIMKITDLIQNRFSGSLNNEAEYIELLVQVFAVLAMGLVLWRMMVLFHKSKKAKRKRNTYFDTEFRRSWRK